MRWRLRVLLPLLLLAANVGAEPASLPEFTSASATDWINSPPLRVADLRGQVVLVDVWTFDCWNCYRSIPWLKQLAKKFAAAGLRLVGIHSPEFDHERKRENVVAKCEEFGIRHPVMMDNAHAYWQALGNRYWPTFYVVDRQGRIRGTFIGETHAGDAQARRVENLIQTLLGE
ncbi:MAG: redoxin domain-containing protein [Gammaproteobacteria bacterium]|nr:redoxin domain-containing protein [Gammaproteobacteria bacterium]